MGKQVQQSTTLSREYLEVSIKQEQEAPLRLSIAKNYSATDYMPEIELVVVNTSTKPIGAYAIRYEVLSGHSKTGGTELKNKMSLSSILQPGQSELAYLDKASFQPEVIDGITISVDFVEFLDGSTWGPDINKSRERLLGLRAGARAATRHFRRVLKESGPNAVLNAIKENTTDITPTPGHSPEWLDGFRGGVGAIRARLENAYTKSGLSEIESELQKPFDASERRR